MCITSRIKTVIGHYQMTASSFADKIGVPRSSISHLISGRNRPSLDFVTKLTATFPEIDLYWLLHGQGTLERSPTPTPEKDEALAVSNQHPKTALQKTIPKATTEGHAVERIVLFYKNGPFDTYKPNSESSKTSIF